MQTAESLTVNESYQAVPLASIDVFSNPRKHFDEAALREMADSLKARGLLQPIVVRTRPGDTSGKLYLVAGERRLRAAKMLGWDVIPSIVRENLCDADAEEDATTENILREDMSPVEEAQAIQKMLGRHDGNCQEVASRLGKGEKFVRARLQLLHCTPAVRDALTTGRIKLGHAELLSAIPDALQENALQAILTQGVSVGDLKGRIASGLAQRLSAARFDTAACSSCHKNSSRQLALGFEEHVGEGHCQDRGCWQQKLEAWIAQEMGRLREEYPVLYTDLDKPVGSFAVIVPIGDDGVGREQADACRTCGAFGVIFSTAPGREGTLTTDACFDLTCHQEKVKGRKDAEEALRAPRPAGTAKTPGGTTSPTSGSPRKEAGDEGPKAAANTAPKRVEEEVDKFYRRLARDVADQDVQVKRAAILYAVLKDAGVHFDAPTATGLPIHGTRAAKLSALYAMPDTDLQKLMNEALSFIIAEGRDHGAEVEMVRAAETVVRVTGTDLVGKFRLTEEFLKAHTKAGIEELLREAGFATWWESTQGPFKKLMDRKFSELVHAVLTSRYDFSSYVPAVIRKRLAASPT